jgi:hypothetical protein
MIKTAESYLVFPGSTAVTGRIEFIDVVGHTYGDRVEARIQHVTASTNTIRFSFFLTIGDLWFNGSKFLMLLLLLGKKRRSYSENKVCTPQSSRDSDVDRCT